VVGRRFAPDGHAGVPAPHCPGAKRPGNVEGQVRREAT